jgi:hypothetical protein
MESTPAPDVSQRPIWEQLGSPRPNIIEPGPVPPIDHPSPERPSRHALIMSQMVTGQGSFPLFVHEIVHPSDIRSETD